MVGRLNLGTVALTSLAWSPDGKLLAAGSYGGEVRLAEPGSGKVWLLSSDDCGSCQLGDPEETLVAFHPKDSKLISASPSGCTYIWDLNTRSPQGSLPVRGPLTALDFSPNGRVLVTTGVLDITAWQWPELKPLATHQLSTDSQRHSNPMIRLAVRDDCVGVTAADQFWVFGLPGLKMMQNPLPAEGHGLTQDGGSWLVAGSAGVPVCEDLAASERWLACSTGCSEIEIVDRQNGQKSTLRSQIRPIYDLSIQNNTLALGAHDGVIIWSLDQAQPSLTISAGGSWGIFPRLSPQAKHLAVAGTLHLWVYEIASGNLLGKHPLGDMLEAVDLQWSANEERLKVHLQTSPLSSGSKRKSELLEVDVKPWKVEALPYIGPTKWHVPTDARMPNGPTRFVPTQDGSIRLVDARTEGLKGTLVFYKRGWLYFQPDGRYDGTPGVEARLVRQGRVHSLKQLPPPTPGLFLQAARGDPPRGSFVWEPPAEMRL